MGGRLTATKRADAILSLVDTHVHATLALLASASTVCIRWNATLPRMIAMPMLYAPELQSVATDATVRVATAVMVRTVKQLTAVLKRHMIATRRRLAALQAQTPSTALAKQASVAVGVHVSPWITARPRLISAVDMPSALSLALALTIALARQVMRATVPSAQKLTLVLRRMHMVDALWHWMGHRNASSPRRTVLRLAQVRTSADARMDTQVMVELAQKSRTVKVPAVETVISMLLAGTQAQDRTSVIAKLVAASNAKLVSHVVTAASAKTLLVGNPLVAL